jgi:peptidoglycan/LPS O-acetylase OafA/YrhL
LPQVVVAISMAVLPLRFAIPSSQHLWAKAHLFPTYLRLDSLLVGVLLSWFFHFHREKLESFMARCWWLLAIGSLALFVPPFVLEVDAQGWYLSTFGLTAHAIASGALLLLALHFRLQWRPLAFIGANSYSIYLWHIPVRFFGLDWIPREWPPLISVAAYLIVAIALGIAGSKLVEGPFLVLRDRLFPTRSDTLPQPKRLESWESCETSLELAPLRAG